MSKRILVLGHRGMVGSAIVRQLSRQKNLDLLTPASTDLDLTNCSNVRNYIQKNKPDQVYIAAAKVGGIHANNTYPAEFISENLSIQNNVIQAAFEADVKKLLFLGSSCIYPKFADQPMTEDCLLTGVLESTNEPYAISKIAGIKMCESFNRQYKTDYRSVMPTNLYGMHDNFHSENSHVIPALMKRFHKAKKERAKNVTVWGSGKPKREFLHVDDMASACIYIMNLPYNDFIKAVPNLMCSHVNVGTGKDLSIQELASIMAKVVGFDGEIKFDLTYPDGAPRKLLDVSLLESMGWKYSIELEHGLAITYNWFLENFDKLRK